VRGGGEATTCRAPSGGIGLQLDDTEDACCDAVQRCVFVGTQSRVWCIETPDAIHALQSHRKCESGRNVGYIHSRHLARDRYTCHVG